MKNTKKMNKYNKFWIDQETKLPCFAIFRNHINLGFWCGYVGIGKDHPYYKKDFNDIIDDISVYGGLTYSQSFINEINEEKENIYFSALIDNYNEIWWLGMDALHGIGDINNYNFDIEKECISLAKHLKALQKEESDE